MAKIGKEKPRMKATPVKVMGIEIKNVPAKAGTKMLEAKDKIVLLCAHKDSKDFIELSKVKYENNGKMQQSALWLTMDDEGNISSNSALAYFLRYYGLNSTEQIVGTEIQTTQDTESGFLIVKAY